MRWNVKSLFSENEKKYQEKENNPFKIYKKAKKLARKYKGN